MLDQLPSLIRLAEIRQVAAEQQDIRLFGYVGEQAMQLIGRNPRAMEIADGGDSHGTVALSHTMTHNLFC
jgi:hypothetical protein